MPATETVSATAPAAWAPYLINGDSSGMEPDDIAGAHALIDALGAWPVDCRDAGFMWRPNHGMAGERCEYIAIV